jgi:iron only hydrogenase large subunit-like protein
MKYHHSVSLNVEKCRGCTHCLRHCPTEAIRIRGGHAVIDTEKCVDCGQCIRFCPYQAKKSAYDKLADIPQGKWKIALPAPSLLGQFDNLDDMNYVLQGLLDIGFDDVYEVASAAEITSDLTRKYLKEEQHSLPVISSACPVIERLIELRYPFLVDNLLPILPPIEIAAQKAKQLAKEKNPSLSDSDICVVFISPCPAKVSYVKNRIEGKQTSVDFVLSMSDIYFELLGVMKKEITPSPLSNTGIIGLNWASTGGEATSVFNDRYLAADGIENVVHVLEEIDNGAFPELEFIELNACPGGCVGGVMTVVNPYIAKARIRSLRRYLPVSRNKAEPEDEASLAFRYQPASHYAPSSLGMSRSEAMKLMSELEKLCEQFPGIDCGSCGAPSCRAFAADVIRGEATVDECPIMLKKQYEKNKTDQSQN